jgi:hypothetical protein
MPARIPHERGVVCAFAATGPCDPVRQTVSGTIVIAPQGHSAAHRPQPLQ